MVACGGEHSLACTEAGDLFAWGWGGYGNLGLGHAEDSLRPTKVGLGPGGCTARGAQPSPPGSLFPRLGLG